jgi:RimJ/RimL family protein N-acetyltransferase
VKVRDALAIPARAIRRDALPPTDGTSCYEGAMLIRPLTDADAQPFWDMRLRAFTESPTSFNTLPDEWRTHLIGEIERLLRGESGTSSDVVMGAFAPALVGQAGLRREARYKRAHKATIWGMFVVPEARGRGIARALMTALLEHARRQEGLVIVQLTVMADNHDAIALYRQFGFERFGYQRRASRHGDRYFDEEHMMLDLDGPQIPR